MKLENALNTAIEGTPIARRVHNEKVMETAEQKQKEQAAKDLRDKIARRKKLKDEALAALRAHNAAMSAAAAKGLRWFAYDHPRFGRIARHESIQAPLKGEKCAGAKVGYASAQEAMHA